ncbi:MAG TPA: serine/threonine-protein kinase [Gemmatimonadales bacterium]|nr:serine/threonine-protein kinase [Gemmatimonadales bacterium]
MPTLLERLRAALAPEYEVERELGSGGMGMVFLGRDRRLDRPVAIKVIHPELASAHAAERFQREAHVLANLNHPNIVPVFDVGTRAGLFYYIMPYLDGETLVARLERGPLPLAEGVQIGRDLLDALQACHRRDVVHRDIKPSNILLVDGRAVLIDFGIAKSTSDPAAPPLTAPGQLVGTVEYMPPEQAAGRDATPQTDLCALAMVLYEAITGRPWTDVATLTGMPRHVAGALRRALQTDPRGRWADAAAFRRALWAPRPRSVVWPIAGIVIAGGIAARVFCGPLGLCATAPPYELMVEPFQVEGTSDPSLGMEIAFLVSDILERFPRIRLVPPSYALERQEDSAAGRRAPPLHVVNRLVGTVTERGDSVDVRVEVRDSLRRRLHADRRTGAAGDKVELAQNLAFWVVQGIRPDLVDSVYVTDNTLRGRNVGALEEFLKGEEAFRQDAWSAAERHFREAWRLDTNFARAVWRRANAQRWQRVASTVDLRKTLAGKWRYLKPLDSLLIAAELAHQGAPRYRIYELALARFPNDPYARLLYGAELMHRGPLAGIPLDSGAAVLEEAVAQNPSLAPAHDQLVWALIRLGRQADARLALDRLEQIRRAPAAPDLDIVATLEVAFTARFQPESLPQLLSGMDPGGQSDVARTLRFALGFDVPGTQLEVGRRLAAGAEKPARRASGHEAQGLALVALGRPAEALGQFDSAAVLFGTASAGLEALEWRILPAAIGVPGLPAAEVDRARDALARSTGRRAAWALAVDAYARHDLPSAHAWRIRFQQRATWDGPQRQLDALLAALDLAARGDTEPALALSAKLLPFDESDYWADPFARALLHVRRAEWLAALGRRDAADREWLWYENSDFEGWLTGEVEAVEVDWALGVWARWRRGAAAPCDDRRRVVELWEHAEPAYAGLVAEDCGR